METQTGPTSPVGPGLEEAYPPPGLTVDASLAGAIPIDDCFGDTPGFRRRLEALQASVTALEAVLKLVSKHCQASLDHAKEHSSKNSLLADELVKFSKHNGYEDLVVDSGITRFGDTLREIEGSRTQQLTQIKETFLEPLKHFVEADVAQLKKLAKDFAQTSEHYESTLAKWMSRKAGDPGLPQLAIECSDARREFHFQSLHYTARLNQLQARKRFHVVEHIVGLIQIHSSFFHQGHELFKEREPLSRELSAYISSLRSNFDKTPPVECEAIVVNTDPAMYSPLHMPSIPATTTVLPSSSKPTKSGYLFLRVAQKLRVIWVRKYFELHGENLKFSSRDRDGDPPTQIDLRLCMVRPVTFNPERRNLFEIVSPNKSLIVQAENEQDMADWVSVLNSGIARSLNSETLASNGNEANRAPGASSNESVIQALRPLPGNHLCCDCLAPDPDWASCNLGIILCITCSGIHRGLGRHVSKVRSLTLDRWEPELLEVMKVLGNSAANAIFEASLKTKAQADCVRPSPSSPRTEKEKWIISKYVDKDFLWDEHTTALVSNNLSANILMEAIEAKTLPRALLAIALNPDSLYHKQEATGYTALHVAVIREDLPCTEFLLQWWNQLDLTDLQGKTALHHAVTAQVPSLVATLLRRNAKCSVKDLTDKGPLDYALESSGPESSKIVAMLRQNLSNNEPSSSPVRSAEPGSGGEPDKPLPVFPLATSDDSDIVVVPLPALNTWTEPHAHPPSASSISSTPPQSDASSSAGSAQRTSPTKALGSGFLSRFSPKVTGFLATVGVSTGTGVAPGAGPIPTTQALNQASQGPPRTVVGTTFASSVMGAGPSPPSTGDVAPPPLPKDLGSAGSLTSVWAAPPDT